MSLIVGDPHPNSLLGITSVTRPNTIEHTVYIGVQTGASTGGSIPLNLFNFATADSPTSSMYTVNGHLSTGACWKSNGNTGTCPGYDTRGIVAEWDLEDLSSSSKTAPISVIEYLACVNCRNSKNAGLVIDANESLVSGDPNYLPLGTAIQTTAGAALMGMILSPVCLTGPCASQAFQQVAYTDSSDTQATAQWFMNAGGAYTWGFTGRAQMLNAGFTDMAALTFKDNFTSKTANYTLTGTDAGTFTNGGATGTIALTLPPASSGRFVAFMVQATQQLTLQAPAGVFICDAATCSAAGGSMNSSTVGSYLTVEAGSSSRWYVKSKNGTWSTPT